MTTATVLHPEGLYRVDEVAAYLRLHPKEVYAIPEELLPKVRVGPKGGAVRYEGRDVIRYKDRCKRVA